MRDVRGVGITEVVNDSPAQRAGLRKDDVILRFEGDNVTSTRKLTRLVSEVAPDHTARLTISRGGSEQEVSVTIAKREDKMNTFRRFEGVKGLEGFKDLDKLKEHYKNLPPGANVWKWEGPAAGMDSDSFVFSFGGGRRIGVSTMQLTKQLADYFGIAEGKGVLVTSVADDSPAARAGIRAGDVIVSVDGEKVEGSGDVSRAINKKKEGDVTLTVIRDKNQRSFTVTPKAAEPLQPGAAPRVGRVIVPRIELGTVPAINVVTPRIELPVIPEIKIEVGDDGEAPRVIRRGSRQPI
jgi:membrane-associated protease RseP (regulator of RpoE activity)